MNKSIAQRQPSAVSRSPFQNMFSNALFNEVFDKFMGDTHQPFGDVMNAALDVAETDQSFEISVDLPGVKSDEVDIQIDNNTLTIRGQRSHESEVKDDDKQFHRIERSSGSFSRSLVLPNAVNESEASAEFIDGVLKIVLPKTEEAKPRKISIKQ